MRRPLERRELADGICGDRTANVWAVTKAYEAIADGDAATIGLTT